MTSVKDKIIWITGASSGIGEELAYRLAEKGATLIISARRKDKLTEIKETCVNQYQANVIAYPLDVSRPDDIKRAVDHLFSKLGRIDVLINNAGYGHTGYFLDYDLSQVEQMFKVNVFGMMHLSQLVGSKMAERRIGHIINVGSIAGKIATPNSSVYASSKHAVLGFSNALRLELHDFNVGVTTINPGPVETPFFDSFDPDGNYVKRIKPLVLPVEKVAKKTIQIIGTNKREVNMPLMLSMAHRLHTLFPNTSDVLTRTVFNLK